MKPSPVIYISGKTCTGKTTLSRQLSKKYNYPVVELDGIIDSLDGDPNQLYLEAYQGDLSSKTVQRFIEDSIRALKRAVDTQGGVIFEGAIANPEILVSIVHPWKSDCEFIYLHPVNINNYTQRIISRFEKSDVTHRNGLPSLFWNKFTEQQLTTYYKERLLSEDIISSITAYAKESMQTSAERLKEFSAYFTNIDVREI